MYNPEYHEQAESIDDELFSDFVEHTKIFKDVRRNRHYSSIDYIGTDLKGRKCSIELKKRNGSIKKYDSIFIECSKFWRLIEVFLQFGYQPIYINFMDDCVVLFDLKKWSEFPRRLELKRVVINNRGYDSFQTIYRYLLPVSEGIIFTKDKYGNWVWIKDNKLV